MSHANVSRVENVKVNPLARRAHAGLAARRWWIDRLWCDARHYGAKDGRGEAQRDASPAAPLTEDGGVGHPA